ncbi:MAG TPA: dihydrolipoamide acetyltransferase family protein [Bacteroidales bacterium]|nr:dihydrolipoamide acetyltransferase family protein [Bacteroidales bacterium]
MAEAVFMPRQGQSVESCIITEWYKKKGDRIETGDLLFSYETDKAAFEEEASMSGVLLDIYFNEGDEVPVLTNVAVIGETGEDISAFTPGGSKTSQPDDVKQEVPSEPSTKRETVPGNNSGRIRISPRARNMADEHRLDVSELNGSGPNGRIIARDVEAYLENKPAHKEPSRQKAPAYEYPAFTADGSDPETTPLSNIRKIIARNMEASLQNSAQLTHHLSADARKILALRKEVKSRSAKGPTPNITLNDMVCHAVIRTLLRMPDINAHFLGDRIRRFSKVHLGIAVDTERGLMVPVLRNADDLSLRGLATHLKSLAESCRTGKIDPELLNSEAGSFTVSNLGAYGIEMFTPVLNLPQAGILGVNTITYRPADLGDGSIGIIPVIGLSLTYDHRAIDGAPASAFLKELKIQIENFQAGID